MAVKSSTWPDFLSPAFTDDELRALAAIRRALAGQDFAFSTSGGIALRTVFSERHRAYKPRFGLANGLPSETVSSWKNAEIILNAVQRDLGSEIVPPVDHGLDSILALHDKDYVRFLETCWDEWSAVYGTEGEAIPLMNVQRGMREIVPETIEGKLSYYALDVETPIGPGMWEAVYWSAQCAITAADRLLDTGEPIYALSRPGGHHAAKDYYGGYCFLSNEGLAIERLRKRGCAKVAYLDIDYHHCNGTQSLFYERNDVLTVSLHCYPKHDYPYFSGFADEIGSGKGEGMNLNLPLPPGTDWSGYEAALGKALERIRAFDADALVVLLGVDTYEKDRICKFKLVRDDYPRIGSAIAGLGLPTVFVKGGGYSDEGLDLCVSRVLGGFTGTFG